MEMVSPLPSLKHFPLGTSAQDTHSELPAAGARLTLGLHLDPVTCVSPGTLLAPFSGSCHDQGGGGGREAAWNKLNCR